MPASKPLTISRMHPYAVAAVIALTTSTGCTVGGLSLVAPGGAGASPRPGASAGPGQPGPLGQGQAGQGQPGGQVPQQGLQGQPGQFSQAGGQMGPGGPQGPGGPMGQQPGGLTVPGTMGGQLPPQGQQPGQFPQPGGQMSPAPGGQPGPGGIHVTYTPGIAANVPAPYNKLTGAAGISLDGDTVVVTIKGLPEHGTPYYDGTAWQEKTETYEGEAVFVKSPGKISEVLTQFRLPLKPVEDPTHSTTPLGSIGVALDGVPFYNQYQMQGNLLGDEIVSFDQYHGHPDPMGGYHYHLEPTLLLDDPAAGGFLGFLADGFPVYGSHEGGKKLTSADLDKYHGHVGETPEYPTGIYHYHFTDDVPYLNGAGYYGKAGPVLRSGGSQPPSGMTGPTGSPPPGGQLGSPPPGGQLGSPPPGGQLGSPPPNGQPPVIPSGCPTPPPPGQTPKPPAPGSTPPPAYCPKPPSGPPPQF